MYVERQTVRQRPQKQLAKDETNLLMLLMLLMLQGIWPTSHAAGKKVVASLPGTAAVSRGLEHEPDGRSEGREMATSPPSP